MTTKIITETFDVLRGRLLGNHSDLHWQLGGQINHQPCSCKAARVIICTELNSAVSSFKLSSAALSFSNKVIPQLDKTLGRTGQTLRVCKVVPQVKDISTTSEKSFIPYKASATVQALKVCPVRPRVLSSCGIPSLRAAVDA